ncbi:MAG: hypothetical protein ACI83W_001795 [Marinoscillum sp.]|jgi:hypothetical protein
MKKIATFTLLTLATMAYSQSTKTITETIEINASSSEVWAVLTDLAGWQSWNPFIIQSEGEAIVGSKLKNSLLSNDKEMIFKPKVLVADENTEFTWLGRLFFPGLFDGKHRFIIEELAPNKVRLVQTETFKGILSGMILKKIGVDTALNFQKMNEALKNKVEGKLMVSEF